MNINKSQALRCIESLRKGIPPEGFIRYFTVGRKAEIGDLIFRLESDNSTALLLKANYGSGKTHLLKFTKEEASDRGYAVSYVVIDSNSEVRFNRMDQIFAAVCRNIEIPYEKGKGVRTFFDFIINKLQKNQKLYRAISSDWTWEFNEMFDSPAMLIGLRAWKTGIEEIKSLIEDWFYNPWNYYNRRKELYKKLVVDLYKYFRDTRPEYIFYNEAIFSFNTKGHEQSWAALRDLNKLAIESGLRGLILLFDEYEDVISNLRRINYQEAAFWNLFKIYRGKDFSGKAFFAVTPDFYEKCKNLLISKQRSEFDLNMLKKLPTHEMTPLGPDELEELALKILEVHGIAYGWEPDCIMKAKQLSFIVRNAASKPIPDRVRYAITSIVKCLDNLYEDWEENASGAN